MAHVSKLFVKLSVKTKFFAAIAVVVFLGVALIAVNAAVLSAAPPSRDFFENAWQETASSTAYSFSCSIASSAPKVRSTASLNANQKKIVDMTLQALKKYKSVTTGKLAGQQHAISIAQEKVNTLGILDSMAAGNLTADQADAALRAAAKKKVNIILLNNNVYYKGDGGWRTFENPEFAGGLYESVSGSPFTAALEKASFVYQNRSGANNTAMYAGTLTADETTSILKPFMGEDLAKEQPLLPANLSVSGDGHIKNYDVNSKIVMGGLSFTVKESCRVDLKNVRIQAPAGAATVDKDTGLKEIVELL